MASTFQQYQKPMSRLNSNYLTQYYQQLNQNSTANRDGEYNNSKQNKTEKLSAQFKSKKNIEIQECNCECEVCYKNIINMKEGLRLAQKEVEYLQFMINFKEIGLEKRDIMLNKYMEQMTQLHEDLKSLKITNHKLKQKISVHEGVNKRQSITIQQQQHKEQELNLRRKSSSQSQYKNKQISQSPLQETKPLFRIKKPTLQDIDSSSTSMINLTNNYKVQQPPNNIEQIKLEENDKSDDQITVNTTKSKDNYKLEITDQISPKSNLSKTLNNTPKSQIITSKNQGFTPKNVLQVACSNRANQKRLSSFSHSISVQIVTNTQGRQEDDVLFRNDQDSYSLMDKGEEDLANNKKLIFLENFFENQQKFYNQVIDMKESQQKQLLKVVNLALNDLKRFFQLSLRYKELLNVTSEIAKYTSFDHAFELILKKIVTHLKCDTASIFLVDFRSQELWTVANKTGNTIRFPLNENSIAGYCVMHEITMNVFDAYEDSRFNKQVDIETGYRTKTILCVPIKDEKNQVVGCLEAINKINDFFNKQDQEMLELMGNFCSSILKNSLKFDKLLIQRDYYKRLIQTSNFIQDSTKIHKMMTQAEQKLKELIGSDQCNIYVIERQADQINLKRYVKGQKEPKVIKDLKSGILYQVIKSQKLQKNNHPKENLYYDNTIDINTSLPLVTVPIFNKDHTVIVGLFQAENVKGFLQKHFGKDEDFQDSPESLYLYGEMIGNAILKYTYYTEQLSKFEKEYVEKQNNNVQRKSIQ